MRAMTRVKAAVAASMALGLALVAAPAFAAPGDFGTSLANANEAVTSGSPIAIGITVAGAPAGADVTIGLSVATSDSSGFSGAEVQATATADGTVTSFLWDGDVTAQLPDAEGYPAYSAYAYYETTPGDSNTRVYTEENSVAIPVVEALQLTVTPTQFTTDGWGEGISFTVGNVPENVDEVEVSISASTGASGGTEAAVTVTRNADGKFVGTLAPASAPKVTAENNWQYFAYASAMRVAGDQNSWVGSNSVELTVVEPAPTTPTAPTKPVAVETGVL